MFVWTSGLMVALGLFIRISPEIKYREGGACPPDGSFTLYPGRYNVWGSSSFSAAKAIDIAWDIVSSGI